MPGFITILNGLLGPADTLAAKTSAVTRDMKMASKLGSVLFIGFITIASCSFAGCAPASYASSQAAGGTLIGAAVGSGVGWLLGNEVGSKTENVLLNSAIGGGIGLLVGSLLHEQNIRLARKREIVTREARLMSKNQMELDALREQVYESSSWGKNESSPWNKRYLDNAPNIPYQGPSIYMRSEGY